MSPQLRAARRLALSVLNPREVRIVGRWAYDGATAEEIAAEELITAQQVHRVVEWALLQLGAAGFIVNRLPRATVSFVNDDRLDRLPAEAR
jgi:DNA-binding CsgD family transcriptional regulator